MSPLRRVNQAVALITIGVRESSFRNVKSISECRASWPPSRLGSCSPVLTPRPDRSCRRAHQRRQGLVQLVRHQEEGVRRRSPPFVVIAYKELTSLAPTASLSVLPSRTGKRGTTLASRVEVQQEEGSGGTRERRVEEETIRHGSEEEEQMVCRRDVPKTLLSTPRKWGGVDVFVDGGEERLVWAGRPPAPPATAESPSRSSPRHICLATFRSPLAPIPLFFPSRQYQGESFAFVRPFCTLPLPRSTIPFIPSSDVPWQSLLSSPILGRRSLARGLVQIRGKLSGLAWLGPGGRSRPPLLSFSPP